VQHAAADVELSIPKLPQGPFLPVNLERRRRIDQGLHAAIMEAWVNGVSTRAVDDLMQALGIGSGSPSRRSAGSRLGWTGSWPRSVAGRCTSFPYVFLDATYLNFRRGGHVATMAGVVATGVPSTGGREILGVDMGDSEDEVFWRGFLRRPREQGLRGPTGHL